MKIVKVSSGEYSDYGVDRLLLVPDGRDATEDLGRFAAAAEECNKRCLKEIDKAIKKYGPGLAPQSAYDDAWRAGIAVAVSQLNMAGEYASLQKVFSDYAASLGYTEVESVEISVDNTSARLYLL